MTKNISDFSTPGQAIRFLLNKKDWTQEDLARILSISLKHTNELIKDKKSISLDIAMSLEKVFDFTVLDWLTIDVEFQLSKKIQDNKNDLVKRSVYLYEFMPINELIKKGWLMAYTSRKELDKQIKSFWNISKNEDINHSFLESKSLQLRYKKSESFNDSFKEFNALVWHQKAINFSNKIKVKDFDKEKLYDLMLDMHKYTLMNNGVSKFVTELGNVGVKFCLLSHLSKTYLDGAAFMVDKNPMVALTGRYDRVDNFWFTLAHELSHVYLHLDHTGFKRTIYIDDTTKGKKATSKEEKEANNMASDLLLLDKIFDYFDNDFGYITEEKVLSFSEKFKLHPSILVGMLAFNKKTSYSNTHRFKESMQDKIPSKYIAG